MQTIKRLLNSIIVIVQKVMVTTGLFIIYIVGFGLTALAAKCTGALTRDDRLSPDTWWRKADGYDNDVQESERES